MDSQLDPRKGTGEAGVVEGQGTERLQELYSRELEILARGARAGRDGETD